MLNKINRAYEHLSTGIFHGRIKSYSCINKALVGSTSLPMMGPELREYPIDMQPFFRSMEAHRGTVTAPWILLSCSHQAGAHRI